MKKDIEFPAVEGVQVAIARHKNEFQEFEWYVYLINYNDFRLNTILVASKGYGSKDGEPQKTSTLRHMIPELDPQSSATIERIDPDVFHLCSEYWVSYYVGDKIYDKKYVFLPDSIVESNITAIKILDLEGILHS